MNGLVPARPDLPNPTCKRIGDRAARQTPHGKDRSLLGEYCGR